MKKLNPTYKWINYYLLISKFLLNTFLSKKEIVRIYFMDLCSFICWKLTVQSNLAVTSSFKVKKFRIGLRCKIIDHGFSPSSSVIIIRQICTRTTCFRTLQFAVTSFFEHLKHLEFYIGTYISNVLCMWFCKT